MAFEALMQRGLQSSFNPILWLKVAIIDSKPEDRNPASDETQKCSRLITRSVMTTFLTARPSLDLHQHTLCVL